MGIWDKTKDAGSKVGHGAVDLGKKGVDLGKKGAHKTGEAIRTKRCVECKNYTVKDDTQGSCPIAGVRMASADVGTCPQKAFSPK